MEVVLDKFELQEIFNKSDVRCSIDYVRVGMKFIVTYNNHETLMSVVGISMGNENDNLYTVEIELEPVKVERETIVLELTFINTTVNEFIQDCVSDNCAEFTQNTLKEIEKIKQDLRKVYRKVLG